MGEFANCAPARLLTLPIINTNLTLLRTLPVINMNLHAFTLRITRNKVNLHQAIFMVLSLSALF